MKILILAVFGAGILLGVGVYLNRPAIQSAHPIEAVAESAPAPTAAAPDPVKPVAARAEQPTAVQAPSLPNPASSPLAAVRINPALDASLLSRTVDLLVSPQASYQQKRAAWKQLRDAGKLDQAIADLEQRTAKDPRTAEYSAALGQAYIQKCGTIQDLREQGILAMQADKAFDTALSLDPSNWEARFTKAVAMTYWPPSMNKGEEVLQHFQTLIQQQEAQVPQPQFAEPYLWMGEQYQKAGRGDDARAIWQRGAYLFPDHEKLRNKLAATP